MITLKQRLGQPTFISLLVLAVVALSLIGYLAYGLIHHSVDDFNLDVPVKPLQPASVLPQSGH